MVPSIKKEKPFLKSVHSSPLKNTALRLGSAIQAHQKARKGKRKGESGWPKYRSWNSKWFSLLYDEPNKGYKVCENILTISLGKEDENRFLKFYIKEAHLLDGQSIRNLRVVKEAGCYYAVFTVEIILPKKKPIKRTIALDPNHKNFAYGVDTEGKGIEIAAPFWLKKYDKRIDELKSRRDHCLKKSKKVIPVDVEGKPVGKEYFLPSKRWLKYQKTLEKAQQKG